MTESEADEVLAALPAIDSTLSFLMDVYDPVEDLVLVNPLDWVVLTEPQYQFAIADAAEALWCDGNQLGKSFVMALDMLHTARGTHPFRENRSVPVEIVIISVSFEQMEPLMAKLWALVPKHEIDPNTNFEKGRGITGKPPRIEFKSGPGKGSVIKFATYKQGASRIAGLTADYVGMDEPPAEGIYGEVKPRLLRKRGLLRVTMTPTPDMPDQSWYKKKVESGEVHFLNHGLKQETVTPRHYTCPEVEEWVDTHLSVAKPYPVPFLYQAEIDKYEEDLLDIEREMRMRGAWTAAVTGRWLPNFSEAAHVRRVSMEDIGGWFLAVGCDHGTQDGKQAAVLVAIDKRGTDRPRVRFLAETVGEGLTLPEHDAEAILQMLATRGLQFADVDMWVGDVPTGSQKYDVRKSNNDLRREFARTFGCKLTDIPTFKGPKKRANSMTYGVAFVNTLFGRFEEDGTPHAIVDPSCAGFIEFCNLFDGDKHHHAKDVGDAGRYALERALTGRMVVR